MNACLKVLSGIFWEYQKANFILSIYIQDKAEILVYGPPCVLVFTQTSSTVRQILPYL